MYKLGNGKYIPAPPFTEMVERRITHPQNPASREELISTARHYAIWLDRLDHKRLHRFLEHVTPLNTGQCHALAAALRNFLLRNPVHPTYDNSPEGLEKQDREYLGVTNVRV